MEIEMESYALCFRQLCGLGAYFYLHGVLEIAAQINNCKTSVPDDTSRRPLRNHSSFFFLF